MSILVSADPIEQGGERPRRSRGTSADGARPREQRVSRRRWLAGLMTVGAGGMASGAYARCVEPYWVEQHEVPMPVRGLPRAFEGFRIVQLTDLHADDAVPMDYLRRVIEGVREARPDLVVVTGDLVTDQFEWVNPISDLLGTLTSTAPVMVSFGNHDYDVSRAPLNRRHGGGGGDVGSGMLVDALEARLVRNGVTVLRNRAVPLSRGDGRIWIVGLEDLWSGRYLPQVAMAGVDASEPVIALSHNPDTAIDLDGYGVRWTLAGHTHGGQVRIPGVGALLMNIQNPEFQQGMIQLSRSRLYVSRGVGFLARVRFCCRPEVPCFVMRAE